MNDARRRIAERYNQAFASSNALEICGVAGSQSSWHLYVLRLRLENLGLTATALLADSKPEESQPACTSSPFISSFLSEAVWL